MKNLVAATEQLLDQLAIPRSIADLGISKDEFERAVPDLVKIAFDDPSWRPTNPRMPLMSELADLFHVKGTGGAAAGIGNDAGFRIDPPHLAVPELPQVKQPLLPPEDVRPARGILGIVRARQLEPGRRLEILAAMFAITHAGAIPAVNENAVHAIP